MARMIAERSDVIPILGEVFRAHGYEGTSLSIIGAATGLGKGSLYHFFPGGKEEMASAVLGDIDAWFQTQVYRPLRDSTDARQAIADMFKAVDHYFYSGARICLVGVFALSGERDRFHAQVGGYFTAWIDALTGALRRLGHSSTDAQRLSLEVVSGVQGGLMLARALDDPRTFSACIASLERRLELE
jgi:AcrR family transcriptional regulator